MKPVWSAVLAAIVAAGCGGDDGGLVSIDGGEVPDAEVQPDAYTGPTVNLAVDISGSVGGHVVSTPAGIDCPGACTAPFPVGISVLLTATPDADFMFDSWGEDCTGNGNCVVTMDMFHYVTASFVQPTLAVAHFGNGGGLVTSAPAGISCGSTCVANFAPNTMVTLTATPDAVSHFIGWGGDCSDVGGCELTPGASSYVTAVFGFDNGDTTSTATKEGSPLWEVAGFQTYSAGGDFGFNASQLWGSGHVYNSTWNAYQPGTVHAVPYDTEVATRMAATGRDPGNLFRVSDWTGGYLLMFGGVIVPSTGAPTGSTADYASGPYIPASLQLVVDGDMVLDTTVVDPDYDGPYPLLTQLVPSNTADGWSHMTLTFGEGAPYIAGVPGAYTFRIHVYEQATPANGWRVEIPFTVIANPS